VKAVPQLQIVLGPETTARGRIFRGDSDDDAPIGWAQIDFDGAGSLTLQSTSPEALLEVSNALLNAGLALVDAIETKKSARAGQAPGADALGEAASATAAKGDRLDYSVSTGSALYPRMGDPVAAPPSNPNEVVEATIYCWADESQPCTCRNGNDCPRRAPDGCGAVYLGMVNLEDGAL
jgi:hypothetical protein